MEKAVFDLVVYRAVMRYIHKEYPVLSLKQLAEAKRYALAVSTILPDDNLAPHQHAYKYIKTDNRVSPKATK